MDAVITEETKLFREFLELESQWFDIKSQLDYWDQLLMCSQLIGSLTAYLPDERLIKIFKNHIKSAKKEYRPPMSEADQGRIEARMYSNDPVPVEGNELDATEERFREAKRGGGGPDDETRQANYAAKQMDNCDRADY